MKQYVKIFSIVIIICAAIFLAIGYLSSYIGWYGYRKWEHRSASTSLQESINRGVFVKELNFKIDSFSGPSFDFKPFIERGFRFGKDSAGETVPIAGSQFPYQLSFNYRPIQQIGVTIRKDQLSKFDSSNAVWGYLKLPMLPDTIILDIKGENIKSGLIKVWENK